MLSGGVSGGVSGPAEICRWTGPFDGFGEEERFDDWDDVGVSGADMAVVTIWSIDCSDVRSLLWQTIRAGPTLSGGVRLSVVMLGRVRIDGGVANELAISTSIDGSGPGDELLYDGE